VDHLRVVLNHLLKEKTVINLSMFCSFHPAECLHNQKSHWPYLSDEISYYSYLMSQEAKYNLRLSLHIFLEILALFRCNMWFWDTLLPHHLPDHPPVHVLRVVHHPEPHKDTKSLQEQTFLPGGQVFNKVFQSQESIDQYVAFLLLIKWAKWR